MRLGWSVYPHVAIVWVLRVNLDSMTFAYNCYMQLL